MPFDEQLLHSIAHWRAAYLGGADAGELLRSRQARLRAAAAAQAQPQAVWISWVEEATLARRLQQLQQAAADCPDRASLLARLPLFGVPFAVKDNIDAGGLPTTAACPAWPGAQQPAAASATVVQRLQAAGAVLLGKTNLDQFATGLVGTRSPHGAPSSVFSAAHVSGGSSSGSAVAVARGDVPFALGTDTAGSGRVPAGFNALVGLKPTPGRVSTAGVLPACRSLDCVSVFALDVHEAGAVLAQIEGADAADSHSRFQPGPARLAPGRALRVGVPAVPVLETAQGYELAWQQALARLQTLGVQTVALDFTPLHDTAALLYEGPWVAERYAVVQEMIEQQPQAMDAAVAEVIGAARRYSAVDTFRAQYRLRAAQQAADALWQQVDVLMVPTAPRHPTHAEVASAPLAANAVLGHYTNFVNLLGWCALSQPCTTTAHGLPFGVTFIAPGDADAALLQWGRQWASAGTASDLATASEGAAYWPQPATAPSLPLVVVGAHLSGLPLNGQLTERGAYLLEATTTAPAYRLYALPGTTPPKPGLQRVASGGQAIAVEVWDMPQATLGSFLALIPAPLGLGSIELADGRQVHGFLCEAHALQAATDISHHGGWRAYLAAR
jgi:allophanate hydrolase